MLKLTFLLASVSSVCIALLSPSPAPDIRSLTVGELQEDKCGVKSHRPGCACHANYWCASSDQSLVCNADQYEHERDQLYCDDAYCEDNPGHDKCGLVKVLRGYNRCESLGGTEACPTPPSTCSSNTGNHRCKFEEHAYDDPGAEMENVWVLENGTVECDDSQPTNSCNT